MSRPRHIPRKRSSVTCSDLLFLNEYFRNGRNGTSAYQTTHPKCSRDVAAARASQVLKKPLVQAEVARRVQYDGGITREMIEADLLTVRAAALATGNHALLEQNTMDRAQLAGLLIKKHADVTDRPPIDRQTLIESLRQRGLVPVN